jgi:hypothetical protein
MIRKVSLLFASLLALSMAFQGTALADGPSGSTECHIQDDDCDGSIDEDAGTLLDDDDGDGRIDEDPAGDVNGDGNADDDLDGRVDEDPADDDADGRVNEDPPGDAADDPGENQVNCNEQGSTSVGGVYYLFVGGSGVEACADDGSALPVDGRGTVTTQQGGYVAIDGDNTNPAPSNGYLRVDQGGVHCGDEANQDSSTANQSGNTPQDCG